MIRLGIVTPQVNAASGPPPPVASAAAGAVECEGDRFDASVETPRAAAVASNSREAIAAGAADDEGDEGDVSHRSSDKAGILGHFFLGAVATAVGAAILLVIMRRKQR
ncbi:unnamed protein product [Polarella glacialis]|uniref:Uncharacterized protein n=1 Tax=Polarella glacialis TaxID=89957 RepID=A0A813LBM2_POLGL|nr:unnamed protein product [Polarella glacialis]